MLEQGKEKEGEKEQFHMLPGGFIDPRKGGDQRAFTQPIVKKMQNDPQYACEKKTAPLPAVDLLIHR